MAKNGNGSTVTETTTETPKAATTDELRKLFAGYDAAQKELEALQAKIGAVKAKRSQAVAAICKAAGKKTFKRDGIVLSAVERVNKETNESNWFFKGPSANDLVEL